MVYGVAYLRRPLGTKRMCSRIMTRSRVVISFWPTWSSDWNRNGLQVFGYYRTKCIPPPATFCSGWPSITLHIDHERVECSLPYCHHLCSQGSCCIRLASARQGVSLDLERVPCHAATRSFEESSWPSRLCVPEPFACRDEVSNDHRAIFNLLVIPISPKFSKEVYQKWQKKFGHTLRYHGFGKVCFLRLICTRCLPIHSARLSSVIIRFSRFNTRSHFPDLWEALDSSRSY